MFKLFLLFLLSNNNFVSSIINSSIINSDINNNTYDRHNLHNFIFENLISNSIPTKSNNPIYVNLSIALRAFNNIDQIDGSITMNIWLRYNWNVHNIRWDSKKWNNIKVISLDTNPDRNLYIWTPDIFLYNTAEKPMDQLYYTKANVYNNGNIFWSRPGLIKSTCTFDMTYFPYDQQTCNIKFGSWAYDSSEIYLGLEEEKSFDVSNYQVHEEWTLSDYSVKKNIVKYPCCEKLYHDIEFTYKLRRRPGYYNLNVVVPTFATSILIIMSLLIPLKSGERISFAVTILLSIIVFLLIVSDNLPKSNTEPLLSRMIIGLIYYSLVVLIFTIIISFIHNYIDELKESNIHKSKIIDFMLSLCYSCEKNKNNSSNNTNLNRNNSYSNAIKIEKCIHIIAYIEKIFIGIFFISFVIYCSIMFSLIPKY